MRAKLFLLSFVFIVINVYCSDTDQNEFARVYKKRGNFFERFFKDTVDINKHLFSIDSLLLSAVFVPAYIGSRKLDCSIHRRFYDVSCHKNKNQAPKWLCDLASKGVAVPLIGLASLSVFSRDPEVQVTSSIFWKGVISIWIVKDIIKATAKHECCLRPACAGFCKKVKYYGGFPSGHMAEAAYMALVYGLSLGPRWGIPLSLYAAFVFGVSVNCNRHYVSQLVAGTGLGLFYALGAHKVIKKRISDDISFNVTPSASGGVKAEVSYRF